MKKFNLLIVFALFLSIGLEAQHRDNYGRNDSRYDNGRDYRNGHDNWDNPYSDPNYYPNYRGGCSTPPRNCNTRRGNVVVIAPPPSYCAPVVIAPRPYYSYARPRQYRHHGWRRY